VKAMDLGYSEVQLLDFEFLALPGERPRPLCLVARDLLSGRELRLWEDELRAMESAPFGEHALLITYYGSAEFACFHALGWSTQFDHLDLFAEFRTQTNGIATVSGDGLLGALIHFGLPAMDVTVKQEMRALAMRGDPYSSAEKSRLLHYCREDVLALERLLPVILARMSGDDLHRALLRGRYMKAAAAMEYLGIPIDVPMLRRLRACWDELKHQLIAEIDPDYGVYVNGRFSAARWILWVNSRRIAWPLTDRGSPRLDDDTFKEVGRVYPEVERIRQLRHALSQLRLNDLAVGSDGRNRQLLSAFRSRTGRNQPSNTQFIFGPAVWVRSLIVPSRGCSVAYVDWEQQEFGIAAYLSKDPNMMAAYESADPYLKFAELAGAVPPGATKASHFTEREKFKQCVLAVLFGMGAVSLAQKLDVSVMEAQDLLRLHRETFRMYWRWSDGVANHAFSLNRLHTVFGWNLRVGPCATEPSLRNFPMQANGAEMLRLASTIAIEGGLEICAPIHDALLLQAPTRDAAEHIARLQAAMAQASEIVLGGPRLKTSADVFDYPNRYLDPRGRFMWDTVQRLLKRIDPGGGAT
jgi:DNA polymerase-1